MLRKAFIKKSFECRPGAAGQGVCGCPDLSLGYNPNTEAGGLTQFHCTTALAWDQLPVRLGAGARCYLRCDYMLVAAIHCRCDYWMEPCTALN